MRKYYCYVQVQLNTANRNNAHSLNVHRNGYNYRNMEQHLLSLLSCRTDSDLLNHRICWRFDMWKPENNKTSLNGTLILQNAAICRRIVVWNTTINSDHPDSELGLLTRLWELELRKPWVIRIRFRLILQTRNE